MEAFYIYVPQKYFVYIIIGKAVILSLPELKTILSVFVEFELLETV